MSPYVEIRNLGIKYFPLTKQTIQTVAIYLPKKEKVLPEFELAGDKGNRVIAKLVLHAANRAQRHHLASFFFFFEYAKVGLEFCLQSWMQKVELL